MGGWLRLDLLPHLLLLGAAVGLACSLLGRIAGRQLEDRRWLLFSFPRILLPMMLAWGLLQVLVGGQLAISARSIGSTALETARREVLILSLVWIGLNLLGLLGFYLLLHLLSRQLARRTGGRDLGRCLRGDLGPSLPIHAVVWISVAAVLAAASWGAFHAVRAASGFQGTLSLARRDLEIVREATRRRDSGALVESLGSNVGDVRALSVDGLSRLAGSSAEVFRRALVDPYPLVRARAARGLGSKGERGDVNALRMLLDDAHAAVRDAARSALKRIRSRHRQDVPAAGVAPGTPRARRLALEHRARARDLFARRRYLDSHARFAAAARLDPGLSDVHFHLALIGYAMGRPFVAMQHLRRELAIHGAHAGSLQLLARIYEDLGFTERALHLYHAAERAGAHARENRLAVRRLAGTSFYRDEFDDDRSRWGSCAGVRISGGTLHVDAARTLIDRTRQFADFRARARLSSLGGPGEASFGIIIRSAGDEFYVVDLARQGALTVALEAGGRRTRVLSRVRCRPLATAATLEVRCLGPAITILVDGRAVASVRDDRLRWGCVGLRTGARTTAVVDWFEVQGVGSPG